MNNVKNNVKREPLLSLILALEAVLVIIGLNLGSGAQMVMSCYWVIVLACHLCEWIHGVQEDQDEEDEENEHGKM